MFYSVPEGRPGSAGLSGDIASAQTDERQKPSAGAQFLIGKKG